MTPESEAKLRRWLAKLPTSDVLFVASAAETEMDLRAQRSIERKADDFLTRLANRGKK